MVTDTGKINGNVIRMAEFKGEVLATLRYLKEQQREHRDEVKTGFKEQSEDIKKISRNLEKHLKKSAIQKWVTGSIVVWLSALTGVLVKIFVLGG